MLRETQDNPLAADFKHVIVLAENFDEAIAKTKAYMKEVWSKTKLDISSCENLFEVDID